MDLVGPLLWQVPSSHILQLKMKEELSSPPSNLLTVLQMVNMDAEDAMGVTLMKPLDMPLIIKSF